MTTKGSVTQWLEAVELGDEVAAQRLWERYYATLLNMAVFGAVIAYVLQMGSFILLRLRLPKLERPYVSPFGFFGAVLTASIAAITLVTLFLNPEYSRGVWGAAVWFLLGILYFALYARRRLVLSPEEEFAVLHESVR